MTFLSIIIILWLLWFWLTTISQNAFFFTIEIAFEGYFYCALNNFNLFLLQLQKPPSNDADCINPWLHLRTCEKYSSAILYAHSLHRYRGRAGLAISAHLINILLISVRFSGVLSATAVDAVESGVPRPLCYKNKHSVFQSFQFLCISYGQFRKNATFSNYRAQLYIAKNWVWQGIRNCVIFAVLDSAGQKIYATNLSNQKQLKLIRSWGLAFPALQRECLF